MAFALDTYYKIKNQNKSELLVIIFGIGGLIWPIMILSFLFTYIFCILVMNISKLQNYIVLYFKK